MTSESPQDGVIDLPQDGSRLDPWKEDGNIVLAVEGKHFRVHRSVLSSYSEIFNDMFACPHSNEAETEFIEGCPVIHLHDSAAEIQIVLKALYDRSYMFSHDEPMPFPVLAAFLRLGKKYTIRQLFEEAKSRLPTSQLALSYASTMSSHGYNNLFPRVSENDLWNFRIMNVAREVGLLSIVTLTALFCCISCPVTYIVDGYECEGSICSLSAPNQRSCILGLAELMGAGHLTQCLTAPARLCNRRHDYSNPCIVGLHTAWVSFRNHGRPFIGWMSDWDRGLCAVCRADLSKAYGEQRLALWTQLPVTLGFGSWEELRKVEAEAL